MDQYCCMHIKHGHFIIVYMTLYAHSLTLRRFYGSQKHLKLYYGNIQPSRNRIVITIRCSDYQRIRWAREINGTRSDLLWEWIFSDLSGLFAWHNKSTPMTSPALAKSSKIGAGVKLKRKKKKSEGKENGARPRRPFQPFLAQVSRPPRNF